MNIPKNNGATDDCELEQIRSHFEGIDAFSQLNKKARTDFFKWLERSRPFRDIHDFQSRLQQLQLKGFKPHHYQAIADSFSLRFSRRPFLTAFSAGTIASLVAGISFATRNSEASTQPSEESFRRLVGLVQECQQTIGQATLTILKQQKDYASVGVAKSSDWESFLHSLDMSNWMKAAECLRNTEFHDSFRTAVSNTLLTPLYDALSQLQSAWDYLLSTREQWEKAYFVAYAFGKMASLAPGNREQPPFKSSDPKAEEHAKDIHNVAPIFHVLEVLNQRFQKPGVTSQHASIRFTQGHNFTYAHVASDIHNRASFTGSERIVLVNWDAHADLSEPFENPRMPVEAPFASLQKASTFSERIVIASSMSISGWILPLIYQGLLRSQSGVPQIVWVVPKESLETSHNYMEPYGTYQIVVGDWLLPESVEKISDLSAITVGDWNRPNTREIRRFSERSTLRSVTNPKLLSNQQNCEIHIVDPDDNQRLRSLLEGAHIALSIDADFSGTREPGLTPRKGFLPHYPLTRTAVERERHNQLLRQLSDFCDEYLQQCFTVSIANSPNFTAEEETRKPVRKILRIVAGDDATNQPEWLQREVNLPDQPVGVSHTGFLQGVLSAGGLGGLGVAVGLLTRDWLRLRRIRNCLFEASSDSERVS